MQLHLEPPGMESCRGGGPIQAGHLPARGVSILEIAP